jgi:ADP-heptose:LPS heptosyltransferase
MNSQSTMAEERTATRLILTSFQSPGDVVMLTAAVRDLHRAHPGRFVTDVRTSVPDLWLHNPYLSPLPEGEPGVRVMPMHYPLVHQSNQRPYHFIHGYLQYLEGQLGLPIPATEFRGDIHLSDEERAGGSPLDEHGFSGDFWIVIAGGKFDFTAKWWNPASYQRVVDHFQGKIQFVQCGEAGHWHPRLSGVIDLVGKTTTRQFVRLVHFADGVLCPVTFAMHLAAAVPARSGKPRHRACVVVAGGREPAHWEAYPQHQFISTNGALPCCADGGCWRSRCQKANDGDEKDRSNLCERPVQVSPDLVIPRCLEMITPEDVIRRIELYYQGGSLNATGPARSNSMSPPELAPPTQHQPAVADRTAETAQSTPPPPAYRQISLSA